MKNKNKLAIFDIDGTIFRKNLQFELLDGLVFAGVFSKDTRRQIVAKYRDWLDNRGTYESYRQELVDLYNKELEGKRVEDIVEVAKRVAAFHHGRIFIYAKKIIERLREDYVLVAISGSPNEIVKEFNAYLNFDAVFGTNYEIDTNLFFTGREINCPARDKAQVLNNFLKEEKIGLEGSFGVGDTESDIAFLEMVENPIAFNPNLNLFRHAKQKGWKVVVERKDVVYEIEVAGN